MTMNGYSELQYNSCDYERLQYNLLSCDYESMIRSVARYGSTLKYVQNMEKPFLDERMENSSLDERKDMKSQQDRVRDELYDLARQLARLVIKVSNSYPGQWAVVLPEPEASQMKKSAVAILGLLSEKPIDNTGRVFAGDLVVNQRYKVRGRSDGEFSWIFLGMDEDVNKMHLCRIGGQRSVELLGDYGLASYDAGGKGSFWHPTIWTERDVEVKPVVIKTVFDNQVELDNGDDSDIIPF